MTSKATADNGRQRLPICGRNRTRSEIWISKQPNNIPRIRWRPALYSFLLFSLSFLSLSLSLSGSLLLFFPLLSTFTFCVCVCVCVWGFFLCDLTQFFLFFICLLFMEGLLFFWGGREIFFKAFFRDEGKTTYRWNPVEMVRAFVFMSVLA